MHPRVDATLDVGLWSLSQLICIFLYNNSPRKRSLNVCLGRLLAGVFRRDILLNKRKTREGLLCVVLL